ncbi:hypothetical protein PHYSODRAFT_286261 [Phytophthora sojae]|uniref:RxLR effector protein n=2 Tax=Phytophthora sojae TaxID=67593 RepID=G4ZQC8_PHYSP|nr:hypothetical protein PHYSODRAFT_286261 [Phytophthora sojae]AEK81256.1 Avh364 [Phytophthora sojae]AEK81257.1 Avh364 [Phytophthora sojae]EGZ15163.1 hypothetical protein PHYSODRAFT_286261 [Phytophthora sojae]|eukprot:XP_009528912.1 hypothetical protein PHYSODRAFT_286261 [Phytophthora sojae]
MRMLLVLLFMAVTLVAIAEASLVTTESEVVQPNAPFDRLLTSDSETKRSLRTEKFAEEEDDSEERANLNFVTNTSIKNWFKPKQASKASSKVAPLVASPRGQRLQAQLDELVSGAKSTDDIFSLLKLDKAGAKLFEGTSLPTYVRYSELMSKKAGKMDDIYGLETLLNHYDEKDLMLLINGALKSNDNPTKTAAEQWRVGQRTYWLNNREDPQTVFKLLGGQEDHRHQQGDLENVPWRIQQEIHHECRVSA